jgi:hypothetical protein
VGFGVGVANAAWVSTRRIAATARRERGLSLGVVDSTTTEEDPMKTMKVFELQQTAGGTTIDRKLPPFGKGSNWCDPAFVDKYVNDTIASAQQAAGQWRDKLPKR